MKITNNKFGWF